MKETISNTNELSGNKCNMFILYYSDHCTFCHMFKDEWDSVVDSIKNSNLRVKPLSIESKHFGDLKNKNFYSNISGVPTMALVNRNGTLIKKYEDARETNTIIKWLKTHPPNKNTAANKKRKTKKGKGKKRKRKRNTKKKKQSRKKRVIEI